MQPRWPVPALRLIRPDRQDEVLTEERCHILELVNTALIPDVSLARARVEPGVTTELHALDVRELYIVLSGAGVVDCGDGNGVRVSSGDVVEIPAGVPQRIQNVGEDDLVFFCLCTPRFRPEGYRSCLEVSPTG